MMHAIASDRVAFPDGLRPGVVHVSGGKIARIEALDRRRPLPVGTLDAGSAAILPGLVDPHVHVNEPGRTEWEGFLSATRAAAAGGVTTLVDMPLNSSPATTCVAALEAKASAAREQCHVDVGFWGGVVPGNEADLQPLVEAGVLGFKCFLVPSGIDEFRHVEEHDLTRAMPILASSGATLLVHAEDPSLLRPPTAGDERKYAAYLASRPLECEVSAVTMMSRLAEETGCRVHIVHVSAAECLPILAAARARGIPVTAETCPHYLSFAAEEIPSGATEFKCAPPIRGRANNERLWKGLREGTLDLIASDHSPCPPAMKRPATGEFPRAWGGIASLQLGLPVVWTESMQRGFGLTEVVRWMSAAPARLCGLHHRKGAIAPGRDADLVVFDTDVAWDVRPDVLHHRHPVTPYVGRRLRGRVLQTYLRGELVYDHGQFSRPRGQWIKQA